MWKNDRASSTVEQRVSTSMAGRYCVTCRALWCCWRCRIGDGGGGHTEYSQLYSEGVSDAKVAVHRNVVLLRDGLSDGQQERDDHGDREVGECHSLGGLESGSVHGNVCRCGCCPGWCFLYLQTWQQMQPKQSQGLLAHSDPTRPQTRETTAIYIYIAMRLVC